MNSQIHDEAAQWLVENQTGTLDAGTRERFSVWLDASPEHVRAYLELTAFWEDAASIDRHGKLDVDALTEAAKKEHNLFPLGLFAAREVEKGIAGRAVASPSRESWRRVRWIGLAASIAVVSVGVAAAGYWNIFLRGVHGTGIGEQRILVLTDGTIVELNAATRIRERFTDAQRNVDLLQGQALFRVMKNPARPFVVSSDTASVRAVGTEFDVHRRASGTTVTVLEGRVALIPITSERGPGRAQPAEVFLGVGEQVEVHEGGADAVVLERVDTERATAWTQQRLEFEFSDLTDVAEDFNRFNVRKLRVEPQGLEDFKVSGTFAALDPKSLQRFVQFLRVQPGLSVVESDAEIVVAKSR